MKKQYIFSLILIAIDIAAGDYKKFIYWIAAAVLNAAVTF